MLFFYVSLLPITPALISLYQLMNESAENKFDQRIIYKFFVAYKQCWKQGLLWSSVFITTMFILLLDLLFITGYQKIIFLFLLVLIFSTYLLGIFLMSKYSSSFKWILHLSLYTCFSNLFPCLSFAVFYLAILFVASWFTNTLVVIFFLFLLTHYHISICRKLIFKMKTAI
ncbi:DUF624 domain-containing protein [Candidatus Enterococcus clewellii]